jgi:NAD(P)-dependent dehydrogenase (short-subunit alcohol dehydrogenase family)
VFLPGTIHEEDDEVFERQMALNVAGSYYFAKAVTRAMKTAGTGTLVNIASTASIKTYPNGGSYAMSKAAMLSMGRGLREELKPYGVRVVNLLPGPVRTASWDGIDLPDDRFMAPADIAEAAWLAYSLPPTTVIEEMLLRPQLGDIGA